MRVSQGVSSLFHTLSSSISSLASTHPSLAWRRLRGCLWAGL
jgi:Zn-dependent protease with chaperone function